MQELTIYNNDYNNNNNINSSNNLKYTQNDIKTLINENWLLYEIKKRMLKYIEIVPLISYAEAGRLTSSLLTDKFLFEKKDILKYNYDQYIHDIRSVLLNCK
jgi:hypothetical protein